MSSQDQMIKSDLPFTEAERVMLKRLAGIIIPASDEYGVPGADDEVIFANILEKARRYESMLKQGFSTLSQHAKDRGVDILDLDDEALSLLLDDIEQSEAELVKLISVLSIQAYYIDGRVLTSLDLEARPPFPEGHDMPSSDWSLLDPVKARGKKYRAV